MRESPPRAPWSAKRSSWQACDICRGRTWPKSTARAPSCRPSRRKEGCWRQGDRLLFVGIVESVVDLQRIRGLLPATDQISQLSAPRPQRCLIEAVVSNSCPLVGKTIRDGRFRNVYNAVVVAVRHNGERLQKKIGDIGAARGDTLLVEAHPSFADQQRNSRDFFLVSRLEDSNPPSHDRALLAVGLLVAMVLAVSFDFVSMLEASLVAAGLMIFTRCVSTESARRSIDWEVLLAIAASFAVGTALEKTGAAREIADRMIALAGGNPGFRWPCCMELLCWPRN